MTSLWDIDTDKPVRIMRVKLYKHILRQFAAMYITATIRIMRI